MYQEQLNCALRAAKIAGEILRPMFHEGYRESEDELVESQIRGALAAEFPGYGYLGEELGGDTAEDGETHCWLVDPHDGTSAAVEGCRGASVSIALLRYGAPVLGVIYAYAAPDDRGDLFWWTEGLEGIYRNGDLTKREWPTAPARHHVALVSQHADRQPVKNATLLQPLRYRAVPGIAYRLALVAAGEGDLAISLNAPAAWDIGGGHALLLGAGGDLFDSTGSAIRYSVSGQTRRPISFCFGGGSAFCSHFVKRSWGDLLRGSSEPSASTDLIYLRPGKTIQDADVLSRAQGCLLGQFSGDALGSLVEFQSSSKIRHRHPKGPDTLCDGGTWDTLAGQPTDDSELALALARCIVANGSYTEDGAAAAYSRWFESRPFDVGNATRAALSGLRKVIEGGGSPSQTAHRSALADTQANGALMRVSPLGILGTTANEQAVFELAAADASLTHPHQVCRDANGIFASAIAFAIRTGSGPQSVYEHALRLAQSRHVEEAIAERLASAKERAPNDFLHNQGWVLIAFQNAFYRLLHSSSFEEGVVATIREGGDTDTNAAIAGALLGAVYGRGAVPQQWRDQILSCRPLNGQRKVVRPRPAEYWPVDALELAEQLLLCGSGSASGLVNSTRSGAT